MKKPQKCLLSLLTVTAMFSSLALFASCDEEHEHSYESTVTKAATCTEDGVMTYTCTECDDTYTEVIPATGHIYENGVCTVCGAVKPSEGLTYTLSDDGTYYIVSGIGDCTDTDLMIPSEYNGLPIAEIKALAFENCSDLTSVIIPDSVTSIGSGAFSGCSGLTSITLPFVGGSADATKASSSTLFGYIFGSSRYTGGTSTKQYYSSSKCKIYYIPSSLTSVTITGGNIFYCAFCYCSNLTSITIPDSVTSIGAWAFAHCTNLTSITIPDSVTAIAEGAFYDCSGLTSITIPDSVTSIGGYAFDSCSGLTSITIPDSVTSIGEYAFYKCTNLTSVTFEDTTTWYYRTSSSSYAYGTETDVSDPETAATYLTNTYRGYYWYKA